MSCDTPDPGHAHVIRAAAYRRERWRNGAGWTERILSLPGDGDGDWDLRLSIASIEQDAGFSRFDGVEREFVLLQGQGLQLAFADGRSVELQPPYPRVRFAGEDPPRAQLGEGPCKAFNLMWKRQAWQVQLLHRPLVGAMVFFSEPQVAWAIHLLGGQASFDPATGLPALAAGDTAWLPAGPRQRFALDGGGELLAVRIERVAEA